jgi:hypothetical protein
MTTPTDGRSTIEYLLGRGRLERIDGGTAGDSAVTIIGRAARRLLTSDPFSAEISADDSAWALSTARTVVEAAGRLLVADPPDLFE